jgi:transcriptional regulator with XRE-family HTH domain
MTTLKFLREQQGLSLRTLAVMAGVHYTSLVRLEAGRYDPRLSTLRKIAEALGVGLQDLLKE